MSDISKYTKQGRFLSIIGVLFTSLGMLFLIINQIYTSKKIDDVTSKEAKLVDSTYVDSVYKAKVRIHILRYLDYIKLHNVDSVMQFYSDTVERYFLLTNITKEAIYKDQKYFWHRYPNSHINYRTDEMTVDCRNRDTIRIFVYGSNQKNESQKCDFVSNIKLNNKLKIVYIRDFKSE